jgi:hypothetical protein
VIDSEPWLLKTEAYLGEEQGIVGLLRYITFSKKNVSIIEKNDRSRVSGAGGGWEHVLEYWDVGF